MAPSTIPKIILDTDPGGDDLFACLWLLSLVRQGLAELVAITTTQGNVAARRTFTTASQILGLVGLPEIEVGRGVLVVGAEKGDASHIHGADGMGNLSDTLPPAIHDWATARSADDLMIEQIRAAPGEMTIVAIGPLTNLAAAETRCPGILRQAKQIVIMAGAFLCHGNVTPQAEFNVWFNPEAAETVLQSCHNTVVIPLDITTRLVFTRAMARSVAQTNSTHPIAQLLTGLCEFMIGTALKYREISGIEGFLVHDAATIGYLFYPETLLLQRATVRVETEGHWTRGQTLFDRRHRAKATANAWVALQVDEVGFFASFIADLQALLGDSHDQGTV
ncbi:nucleoside hydrolase [Leptolyngbya sp. 'hensonii']|uniref:nucleoside hydrolase n=1 Tax=Leptolyngbya sp. 'hensonii' TaxID=1922337 RepID=UPI00094F641F|nr:nucleoside hydrolase [Leptolyngbya sp. 'hensonii']OLP18421.1 nucleoside hydrolase [Leptolyngbya sp. 'hensonii']